LTSKKTMPRLFGAKDSRKIEGKKTGADVDGRL